MADPRKATGWLRGFRFNALGPQIAVFLSMALLPIGFLAIYQTRLANEQASRLVDTNYVALTVDAAAAQREIVERSFGMAEALGSTVRALSGDWSRCSESVRTIVDRTEFLAGGAFVDSTGMVQCSSSGRVRDVSGEPIWATLSKSIEPRVTFQANTSAYPSAVLIISQPVYVSGEWFGYVILTSPSGLAETNAEANRPLKPLQMLIFSDDGNLLMPKEEITAAEPFLPQNVSLAELSGFPRTAAQLESVGGKSHKYVVIPIEDEVIYMLGVWPTFSGRDVSPNVRPELFPLLMWLASMLVAYLALDRLVLRHLRALNSEMREFGQSRRIAPPSDVERLPAEFEVLQNQFVEMAEAVVKDEEELEKALSQKSILLKEVHHRVKNNLQMISSIMNMQIRQAETPEMRSVLTRLQDRILGLALAHRTLHEIEEMGHINARRMIMDLLDQIKSGSPLAQKLHFETDFDDVELYPNQTVPLSLLFSEMMANAIRYAKREEDGRVLVSVSLKQAEGDEVVVTVSNAVDPVTMAAERRTGLGRRLIAAFASQLNATVNVSETENAHNVSVRFKPETDPLPTRDF